jgi:hypothetical protein
MLGNLTGAAEPGNIYTLRSRHTHVMKLSLSSAVTQLTKGGKQRDPTSSAIQLTRHRRWFGVVVLGRSRLGEVRCGETILWPVIAAQIAARERRGSRRPDEARP